MSDYLDTNGLQRVWGKFKENISSYKEIENVNIATFTDGTDNYVKSLEVAIEPQQDLHGYDAPWVGGAGKNKLPMTVEGIKAVNTDGTWSGNTYTHNGVAYTVNTDSDDNILSIKVNGTSTSISYLVLTNTLNTTTLTGCIVNGLVANVSSIIYRISSTSDFVSLQDLYNNYTIEDNGNNRRFSIRVSGSTTNEIIYPMIRLASETDPTFEPYSNICPISGWDECNITEADDLESPTTSNVYTIDLNGTRYGGKLDVVNGVLTVEYVIDTDLGEHDFVYVSSANIFHTAISGMEYTTSSTLRNKDIMSSAYKVSSTVTINSDMNDQSMLRDSGRIYIRDTNYSDVTAFKNAVSGVQLFYKLATPQTIQLTPTIIKSLQGDNNFFADSGEIIRMEYQPDNIVGELRSEIADVKKVHTVKITDYDDINHTATLDKSVRQIMNLLSNGEYVVIDTNGLWVELDVNYYLRPLEMGAVTVTFNLDNIFESPAPTPFSYGQTVTFSYIDSYQLYCELPYLGDDEYGDTNEVECRLARYTAF